MGYLNGDIFIGYEIYLCPKLINDVFVVLPLGFDVLLLFSDVVDHFDFELQ